MSQVKLILFFPRRSIVSTRNFFDKNSSVSRGVSSEARRKTCSFVDVSPPDVSGVREIRFPLSFQT